MGHNEYITDITGRPYQYFHFSAFGESLIEKNTNYGQFSSPYRFNAKELDGETGNYYYGARYYNPVWGVWLGVDPLAERSPQYSPYVFTFNNPILFVDTDGRWPYSVTFRSFHPSKSFGKGRWFVPIGLGRDFSGDNRGFSLLDGASSRITHRVVADPEKGTVTYAGRGRNGTFSDASHHPYFGTDTDTPDGYVGRIRTGGNSLSFETGYEGTNPLAYGPTPDIDVDARLSIVQDGDILSITGQVAGDDFPNTEAFITDPSGKQKLFIGVDVRAAGEDQNPTILFGPATEQIMNINMQIRINPDNGNFIGVMRNGQWVKPDEWNKTFLNQNPNPQN